MGNLLISKCGGLYSKSQDLQVIYLSNLTEVFLDECRTTVNEFWEYLEYVEDSSPGS